VGSLDLQSKPAVVKLELREHGYNAELTSGPTSAAQLPDRALFDLNVTSAWLTQDRGD
jgi:hypothetical protein